MIVLAKTQYAYAIGSSIALASLNNFENHYHSVNRKLVDGKLYPVVIASPILDFYPIRRLSQAGIESGDGRVDHEWNVVLCTYGVKTLYDEWWSSGSVVSTAVTLNTRRFERGDYVRVNAYAVQPSRNAGDIEYLRHNLFRVRIRFHSLVVL